MVKQVFSGPSPMGQIIDRLLSSLRCPRYHQCNIHKNTPQLPIIVNVRGLSPFALLFGQNVFCVYVCKRAPQK